MNESAFKSIRPEAADPIFNMIGAEWLLLSASDGERTNTMTVSWATVGKLWNKNVAICYVRPQRYTHEILENTDHLTLTVLPEGYRDALNLCGKISGRDGDKFEKAGLTVANAKNGAPYPAEGKLVLSCKKLYADDIREDAFIDPKLVNQFYNQRDFHRFYVCEIEQVLIPKN